MHSPKSDAALEMDSKPKQQEHHQQLTGTWSSGLCGCCSDVPSCLLTCFCPCIAFGRIAEITDKGTTTCAVSGAIYCLLMWFTGCSCLYSCMYRTKLRKEYVLEERPCNDCLVHWCCEPCAICQEYRELKHRGCHVSSGWEGNMQKQNLTSAPVVEQGMNRWSSGLLESDDRHLLIKVYINISLYLLYLLFFLFCYFLSSFSHKIYRFLNEWP